MAGYSQGQRDRSVPTRVGGLVVTSACARPRGGFRQKCRQQYVSALPRRGGTTPKRVGRRSEYTIVAAIEEAPEGLGHPLHPLCPAPRAFSPRAHLRPRRGLLLKRRDGLLGEQQATVLLRALLRGELPLADDARGA